jgi:hypothetical protein
MPYYANAGRGAADKGRAALVRTTTAATTSPDREYDQAFVAPRGSARFELLHVFRAIRVDGR